MAEPLRLLLVGGGAIAGSHLQALALVPELRLVALVDPEPEARRRCAAGMPLPTFASLDEWRAAEAPADAALLAAPPHLHEPLAVQLLQAGLHVLCEKPLAPTPAAARRMVAAATAAHRRLMLASKFRYGADVAAARTLLAAAAIGAVQRYDCVFTSRSDFAGGWRTDPIRAGGGVLMDNGSHVADLARCLLGPIARVQAMLAADRGLPVETTACVQFQTRGGVLGTADLSWTLPVETPVFARLRGSQGTIELGWRASRWRRHDGDWQVLGLGYDKTAALAAQLADFAAHCATAAPARLTAADALAAVEFTAAAYASAAAGTWVDLPADGALP
ncbi:MAG: Gfo/Idh/MocA family oxidoreductase [Planctomycetes bacterium]|nr:Gfo/Idh/MocA family oxidoreductase [Planctomycetota bacterium]